MRTKTWLGILGLVGGLFLSVGAYAQEPVQEIQPAEAAAPQAAKPAEAAAPQEAKSAEAAAPADDASPAADNAKDAAQPQSDDPGDIIAAYFTKMADIVAQNMETPSALLEKLPAFIKENEKAMRNASKKFDAKMSSLKAADAEVYRETVQRKITPQLHQLISLLVDFSGRYPNEAQQLDSVLKIDAKYTYQQ